MIKQHWKNLYKSYRFYKRGGSHGEAIGAIAHFNRGAATIVNKIVSPTKQKSLPLASLVAAEHHITANGFYRSIYADSGIAI